jgi:ornithine carrier protein
MQVQMLAPRAAGTKPPGPFALIGSIVRQHGLRGLWLGHTGTLIRETGGSAAWFTTKEAVATSLASRRAARTSGGAGPDPTLPAAPPPPPLTWESAFAGACAGAAYNLALFPADTVKSTVQTADELRPGAPRPSYFGTAGAIWRAQGLRGLYAGCGITILRSVPSSAMVFALYDGLKERFG